jgi:predicted GTPase
MRNWASDWDVPLILPDNQRKRVVSLCLVVRPEPGCCTVTNRILRKHASLVQFQKFTKRRGPEASCRRANDRR